jgi:chromosome segregation ATPase
MKLILPILLALVCLGLGFAWYSTKQADQAQQQQDASAIADLSNQLTSAQSRIASGNATIETFSNHLDEARSSTAAFSNQLAAAQSDLDAGKQQIATLNQQVADMTSHNQALDRQLAGFTNQVTGLTAKVASITSSLVQTNQDLEQTRKDYLLLDNRFRISVAERIVAERKFNNPPELKAQLKNLKQHPAGIITAERIYAELNVEVKSNGWCHVITPN